MKNQISEIQVGKTPNQYPQRLEYLKEHEIDTRYIEETIEQTFQNIENHPGESLIIFGEPQSGKTEMMIALNAKLLDSNKPVIINLITDSVDLLNQNLDRFRQAGLNPSPKEVNELNNLLCMASHNISLNKNQLVIFSKKNAKDLDKLNKIKEKLNFNNVIIIDDEADFASPNSQINQNQVTKINSLITDLLGNTGQYIGVTATPARLDLNNTFKNKSKLWVRFEPHKNYVGQDFFFPNKLDKVSYRLYAFEGKDENINSKLEEAILYFLCGVAEQHIIYENKSNFSMLIHTSSKKEQHQLDFNIVGNIIADLSNQNNLEKNIVRISNILESLKILGNKRKEIIKFIFNNISRNTILKINSSPEGTDVFQIAKPSSLFCFGIGGNIISRGVTFENLLSLYFTRNVKGKFAQDTYIQRARMFGNRKYKEQFQLWVPKELMQNWLNCFKFHKLGIKSINSTKEAPIWLANNKTTPTAPTSISNKTVVVNRGEIASDLFDYQSEYSDLFIRDGKTDDEMLQLLKERLSKDIFPEYFFDYLKEEIDTGERISFHQPSMFGSERSKYTIKEKEEISRSKGIFSSHEFNRSENPNASHHIKLFYNNKGKARIIYKLKDELITSLSLPQ